ncbi:uncharacterized protein K452DRAFT_56638 [Aplosporella prunicola CBS 121167]|uniref:Uncharacterized protein n=1 Tax=Aplosporella prunicola CBS 121167 TaxID=1176127 RepID=A0A6A6B9C4_9PEZI|nr:uncharacterized protein K452DRAFT_56638 [Aplosporella prunicola CBS 121167]KAF2139844.1 hypothetical protein K452DRAFT_56638 [Aplosporella prunicola CBS 121167]
MTTHISPASHALARCRLGSVRASDWLLLLARVHQRGQPTTYNLQPTAYSLQPTAYSLPYPTLPNRHTKHTKHRPSPDWLPTYLAMHAQTRRLAAQQPYT